MLRYLIRRLHYATRNSNVRLSRKLWIISGGDNYRKLQTGKEWSQ